MLIKEIKEIINDIKLTKNQMGWLLALAVVIILSLGTYSFYFKKDDSDTKDAKYLLIEKQISDLKSLITKQDKQITVLYNNNIKLENSLKEQSKTINKLSENTDNRLLFITKQVATKSSKSDIIDVINMTKTDKLKFNISPINLIKEFNNSTYKSNDNSDDEDVSDINEIKDSININNYDTLNKNIEVKSEMNVANVEEKVTTKEDVKETEEVKATSSEEKPGFFGRLFKKKQK